MIFIFFWALQCHKQSEYEYYQNTNLTANQIEAGAEVIGNALGINIDNVKTQLSNAGNNITNVFKGILTNNKK